MGFFTRSREATGKATLDAVDAEGAGDAKRSSGEAPEAPPIKTRVLAQLAKVARWAHVLPPRADAGTPDEGAADSPKKRTVKRAKETKTSSPEKAAARSPKKSKTAAKSPKKPTTPKATAKAAGHAARAPRKKAVAKG